MATKESDIHGVYACSACHDVIDRRMKAPPVLTEVVILDAMIRALSETQARMVEAGIIMVKS
jgi:hypothetical protein